MVLHVVGIGPGDPRFMAPAARKALKDCDVVAGYEPYIDLIYDVICDKEVIKTGMKQEAARCESAIRLALEGKKVCMVSSGDPGVYGMAGLMIEIAAKKAPGLIIEVLPGITAATAAGAILGAPLSNDFAVVSLSDLLTPLETIKKRLRCAFDGGFCVCLYNPSSKKRSGYLKMACDIALSYRAPDTPCGMVRNIARDGQTCKVLTLHQLAKEEADMFTTVIIGNDDTEVIGGKLVTKRGYKQC